MTNFGRNSVEQKENKFIFYSSAVGIRIYNGRKKK